MNAVDLSGEADWHEAVARASGGRSVDSLAARSADGVLIRPLYPSDRRPALARAHREPVTVFQRIDHPEAEKANRLARLDAGDHAAGLALCFARSIGARGFGIPDQVEPLGVVLDGLDLGRIPVRLDLPPFAGPELALAVVRYADRGASLALDAGFDPIGDMARTGDAPESWPALARGLCRTGSTLRSEGFDGPWLRVDGRPVHEAGGTEAQELGFVVAAALTYLRTLDAGGLALEDARRSVSFTLVGDPGLLLTVAKCRALRMLWSGIEACCGLAPEPLRLHVETAWRCLTRRGFSNNIVRGTLGCAAAVLGTADSVTVLPHTSPFGLPDADARRLSRNTPLILLQEAHLGRVVDVGAGAGAVAGLTEALRSEAWSYVQALESAGGLPASLRSGDWQTRVGHACERRREALRNGALPLVGSTVFASAAEEHSPAVLRPTPSRPPLGQSARWPALPSWRDEQALGDAG